jgi:hypothetical protein
VCKRCDYILDSSFLGSDILNERTRDSLDDDLPEESENELGGDALILGSLDDNVEPISYTSDRTGVKQKAPAQVYLTGEISRLLLPGRVLRHTSDADDRREVLSEFELAIFDLIDGVRTLAEVQEVADINDNELCVTCALLYEKRLIEAGDAGSAPAKKPPARPVTADIDDHTNELHDLPPLARPGEIEAPSPFDAEAVEREREPETKREVKAKKPPPIPSDDNETFRVPRSGAEKSKAATPPARAPEPQPLAQRKRPETVAPVAPAASVKPALRPAMKSAPLPQKPKPALAVPVAASQPSVAAPRPAAPVTEQLKRRASGYYDACMKELRTGRPGRAWGYAKMAADADPGEEKYQELLRDWSKIASIHNDRPASPSELMAAAQEADNKGDTPKAVELLQKLIEMSPSSAAAYNYMAVLLATKMKQFRPAYDAAIKAVEIEPGNMSYQSNMMKILARVDADERNTRGDDGKSGLLGRLLRR